MEIVVTLSSDNGRTSSNDEEQAFQQASSCLTAKLMVFKN